MSRLLVALVLALGLGVVTAVAVNANAGPHGNYDVNTGKCAACHRAHTAVGAELITAVDEYALCTSCHGGDGADTNVMEGVLNGTSIRLNGGGFESMPMTGYPDEPGAPVIEDVTSTHTVEGLGGSSGEGILWGSLGPDGNGPGYDVTLECASCHNPHGSTNYRILRDTENGHGAPDRWLDLDLLRPWQDEQVLKADNVQGILPGGTEYTTSKANFTSGLSFFCANCHTEYLAPSHNATDSDDPWHGHPGSAERGSEPYQVEPLGDALPRFRHAVVRSYGGDRPVRFAAMDTAADGDPTALNDTDGDANWDPAEPFTDTNGNGTWDPGEPFEDINNNGVWNAEETWNETNSVNETARRGFNCLMCHYAHGTAASMTGSWTPGAALGEDSALLYYDQRATCRACHQSNK